MSSENERKNQRIGIAVSVGLHALMLLLFFLVLAWREPDPPIPEYGIELNFGLQDAGTGEVQPEEPSSAAADTEAELIQEQPVEEVIEQSADEELIEEFENIEDEPREIIDSESLDSPDIVEPEENKEKQPEDSTPVEEELVEEITKPIETPVVPAEEETGQVDNQAIAKDTQSQGDNTDVVGDEGVEEGSLDSRALYGSHGGGGGPFLELTGWVWDFEPNPKDTSAENGKIVFEIKIDDRGEIISVRTIEKTVSPGVERIYRDEVESLTFSPLSTNTIPAAVSTGRITFIIRSK